MSTIYEIGTNGLSRRTEKGWTIDFIFNREGLDWISGSTFYYWGISDETNPTYYVDNNLSFSFTDDGRIKWQAIRYSGVCDSDLGYSYSYYTDMGQTIPLCTTDPNKDFNITIVFNRNKHYTDCNIENDGGWNDLILGPHAVSYVPENSGSTSTQIATGYTITNQMEVILSGSTPSYQYIEELNKKWWSERERRLGTLKIYLNGNPIYKLKDWEEVIPSQRRSTNQLVQIWGGGTSGCNDIHVGETQFALEEINYYQEPLDFLHVKNNFLTRQSTYDFFICGLHCYDDMVPIGDGHLLEEGGNFISTGDNNHIIFRG